MIKIKATSNFVSVYSYIEVIENELRKFVDNVNKSKMNMTMDEVDQSQIRPDFMYRPTRDEMIAGAPGDPVYVFPCSYEMEFNEKLHIGTVSELSVREALNDKFAIMLAGLSVSHLKINSVEFEVLDDEGNQKTLEELEQEAIEAAKKAGVYQEDFDREVEIL